VFLYRCFLFILLGKEILVERGSLLGLILGPVLGDPCWERILVGTDFGPSTFLPLSILVLEELYQYTSHTTLNFRFTVQYDLYTSLGFSIFPVGARARGKYLTDIYRGRTRPW
jgi:hypothetical protein